MAAYTAEDASPTLFLSSVAPLPGYPGHGAQQEQLRDIAARDRRGHVALCCHDLDAAERHFSEALELPGARTPLASTRMHLADARWHRAPAAARRLAEAALAEYQASARPERRQLRRMQTWLESHVEHAA